MAWEKYQTHVVVRAMDQSALSRSRSAVTLKQGWELGLFATKLLKFGLFQKWFGRRFFVWRFGFF